MLRYDSMCCFDYNFIRYIFIKFKLYLYHFEILGNNNDIGCVLRESFCSGMTRVE